MYLEHLKRNTFFLGNDEQISDLLVSSSISHSPITFSEWRAGQSINDLPHPEPVLFQPAAAKSLGSLCVILSLELGANPWDNPCNE